ncbi:MAG: hypothetical protein ACPGQP_04240, partial [Nitrosopumilus sp.]
MEINEILELVKNNKIPIKDAKKLLSIYSIEEIENIAKIDVNRRTRRGIPEVVFAETKELEEIKKITEKFLEKTNSVMISRLKKEDYKKMIDFGKR